ncbi:MAG TPA: DUF5050 domain-containing protein [Clostridia bacterium]|nr:DUF5050 domain-containing protein [Clostridia bacterium]
MGQLRKKMAIFISVIMVLGMFSSIVNAEGDGETTIPALTRFDQVNKTIVNEDISYYANTKSPVKVDTAKKVGDWVFIQKSTYNYGMSRIEKKAGAKPVVYPDTTKAFQTVGQWIYYVNYSDGSKLYRVKNDGSGKKKVINSSVASFEVSGNWIVYTSKNGYTLFRAKLDGSGNQAVGKISEVNSFKVFDSVILYSTNNSYGSTFTVKLNGSGNKELVKQAILYSDNTSYYKGFVFYIDDNKVLTKIKADGTGKPAAVTKELVKSCKMSNEWVYYVNKTKNYSLFKMKSDGTSKKIISSTPTAYFKTSGNYLYCKDIKGNGITRVKNDGSGKLKVCELTGNKFEAAGDAIFFTDNSTNKFVKVKADGKGKKVLSSPQEFAVASDATKNKWVWYSDKRELSLLYRTNEKTKAKLELVRGIYYDYTLYNETLYYRSDSEIFSKKLGKTPAKKIYSGGQISSMIINNGMIYFRKAGNGFWYIGSMKTNGTALAVSKLNSGDYEIAGSYISFTTYKNDGISISRMNTRNGKIEELVPSGINYYVTAEGYVFYGKKGTNTLYSKSIIGSKENLILQDETQRDSISNSNWAYIANGWVYYLNAKDQNYLYKAKYDGSGKTKVLDKCIRIISIGSGWIICRDTTGVLLRVKTDGTGAAVLFQNAGSITRTMIAGDRLYYNKAGATGLYCMKIDGTGGEKLLVGKTLPLFYFIAGDYLYYYQSSLGRCDLCRIKFGGNKIEIV